MSFPLNKQLVDQTCIDFGLRNAKELGASSIRQLVGVVKDIERATGVEFIHMELGEPGLPAEQIGIAAEHKALKAGMGSKYPLITGITEVKHWGSEFVRAFINLDIPTECIVPTVGSMQAAFAINMLVSQLDEKRDTILFLDPCFPVQKQQCKVIGVRVDSFDVADFRGEALAEELERHFKSGRIAAMLFSNPNNPSWMCLTERELEIIGRLAAKYDVVVIEDLAYMTMDFRRDIGKPFEAPYQPTVAKYTDNYVLMMSASKIFSYAGQRIALACISDKLYHRHYDALASRYGISRFGAAFAYTYLYTFSSGVSHSAQYAMAAMLNAACDGSYRFVEDIKEYAVRTARIKDILYRNGFHVVYDKDNEEPVSDGFFFTIGYRNMSGAELIKNLLYYGVSGIDLATTGSSRQGIRACSSNIKPHHYDMLEERLKAFDEAFR